MKDNYVIAICENCGSEFKRSKFNPYYKCCEKCNNEAKKQRTAEKLKNKTFSGICLNCR